MSKKDKNHRHKSIKRVPKPKDFFTKKRVPKLAKNSGEGPLIVVKKQPTPEELQEWLSTVSGWVEGLTRDMEGNESEFYDYQVQHMENKSNFRHIDKARQVGFSYTFAAEALAKCHLKNLQTSIYISYNQEEANEKIRFARALYDSLPLSYQRRLVVDNKQSLEFEDGSKHRTRILSFAQRQPRGKGNNTDVYLDEFAHMTWGSQIYVASLPVITRGSGVLTLASTPLGKGNLHYEISVDKDKYDMFSRMRIYWWDCPELCIDVKRAREEAPFMDTKERIAKFALPKLKLLHDAMEDEDDFMQEYELHYVDESYSYFPISVIKPCVFEYEQNFKLEDNIDPNEISAGWAVLDNEEVPDTIMEHHKVHDICWYFNSDAITGNDEQAFSRVADAVEMLLVNMNSHGFGRNLIVGVDIGRKRDTSEISILEQIELPTHNLHVERLAIELSNVKFRMQEKMIRHILKKLPISKMKIDKTGIGMNLSENLEDDFPSVVEGIEFNAENKGDMAKNFRFRLEDRCIALYNDAKSLRQIHSIKKNTTEAAHVTYAAEKSKEHHGDKFWAKALASSAGDGYDRNRVLGSLSKFSGNRVFALDNEKTSRNAISVPRIQVPMAVRKPNFGNPKFFADPYPEMFADMKYHGD